MSDHAKEIADHYILPDGANPKAAKPPRGNTPSKGKHAKRKHRVPTGPSYPPLDGEIRKSILGAPSSYRPEFATQLILDHANGYSLSGFAGRIGVDRTTLLDWVAVYPAFAQAHARAKAARARWFEQRFLDACETGGIGSQANLLIFGLINAAPEDYKQKQEVNHTGQLTLAALVEQSMKQINPPQTIDAKPIDQSEQDDSSKSSSK